MTYCAGWKYANSVYLIADSAATKSIQPATQSSSFGELHRQVKDEHVEESLLKLVPLGPGSAVAFAGDVQRATKIIDFLRDNVERSTSGSELLAWLTSSLGPFDPTMPVEILLATTALDKPAELTRWDSTSCVSSGTADYYQIGSLTSYHSALTPEFLSRLVAGKLPADRVLPIITALVQSYGIHDNLIDQNIGGLIFGLRCTEGSMHWQEDTNFVLHDPSFSTIIYVSAFARDNAIVVNSSATNDVRVFMHSSTALSPHDWMMTWSGYVRAKIASDHYRYWVFIRTQDKCITVVRRDDPEKPGGLVKTTAIGNGRFDLAIEEGLMAVLCQPLDDLGDGSVPIRLNFRNDPGAT